MKLWQKNSTIDDLFERFTIGDDPELDLYIAEFDVIGSIAHVKMLEKVGLLKKEESAKIVGGLNDIRKDIQTGSFSISKGVEDCHSEIEFRLTQKLGDLGKKVHSGRSRNDQVLTALKLFARSGILNTAILIKELFQILQSKSEAYKNVLMPGYTHMQVAMPSSFGLWFGAYAESLSDDLNQLKSAYEFVNRSPLGSAAGYGSSFPLDRDYSAELMGFDGLNVNSVYAQMNRGKMEKIVSHSIALVASTLARWSMDVILYMGQDFSFLEIDQKYTTGSSIMPHKNNPDGFELVRAKCNQLQSLPLEIGMITTNLPTGYHRDFQQLKQHFIPAFQTIQDCLEITRHMTESIRVRDSILDDSRYDLLFTVEKVNKLVAEGVPFRDAYKKVSQLIREGEYVPDRDIRHVHTGSIGNPGIERIRDDFTERWKFFEKEKERLSHLSTRI